MLIVFRHMDNFFWSSCSKVAFDFRVISATWVNCESGSVNLQNHTSPLILLGNFVNMWNSTIPPGCFDSSKRELKLFSSDFPMMLGWHDWGLPVILEKLLAIPSKVLSSLTFVCVKRGCQLLISLIDLTGKAFSGGDNNMSDCYSTYSQSFFDNAKERWTIERLPCSLFANLDRFFARCRKHFAHFRHFPDVFKYSFPLCSITRSTCSKFSLTIL